MNEELKIKAGRAVCRHMRNGMRLGIGSGSTVEAFIRILADQVRKGLQIVGVPTSERTARLCGELGIPLATPEECPRLDLAIDGADEVDPVLSLIKGGGGALLREKIVAAASDSMYVIVDKSKLVSILGTFTLPVEVNLFGLGFTKNAMGEVASTMGLNNEINLRTVDGGMFITEGGNCILDASFGLIHDVNALDKALLAIPGVVQHGLFIDMAHKVFVSESSGVRVLERKA